MPGPARELTALPRFPSWIKGEMRGGEERGKEVREKEEKGGGKERKWKDRTLCPRFRFSDSVKLMLEQQNYIVLSR